MKQFKNISHRKIEYLNLEEIYKLMKVDKLIEP